MQFDIVSAFDGNAEMVTDVNIFGAVVFSVLNAFYVAAFVESEKSFQCNIVVNAIGIDEK